MSARYSDVQRLRRWQTPKVTGARGGVHSQCHDYLKACVRAVSKINRVLKDEYYLFFSIYVIPLLQCSEHSDNGFDANAIADNGKRNADYINKSGVK